MKTNETKLLSIKQYIKANYIPDLQEKCYVVGDRETSAQYSIYDDMVGLRKRVKNNISNTWQEAMFNIIDRKFLNEVQVYKDAGLTKQTFSKIRSNKDYHPDKDTAVCLCIGLKLNLDETLDLLGKAGYTLSKSIERDIIVMFFIENEEYDIYNIDAALEDFGIKTFLKY